MRIVFIVVLRAVVLILKIGGILIMQMVLVDFLFLFGNVKNPNKWEVFYGKFAEGFCR